MRVILPLLLLITGCAPYMLVPVEGVRHLTQNEPCFVARGVAVFRYETDCPDFAAVEERVRRVEERWGCSLAGQRLYYVNAQIDCGGKDVKGCTWGEVSAVTKPGPAVMATSSHELAHACFNRLGGAGDFRHIDLDERWQRGER